MYNYTYLTGDGMETATIRVKTKKVGNSLALFIPAEVRDELGLRPTEEVIVHIHKKKDIKPLLALFGATKGKLGPWNEKEDRLDARY